MLTRSSLSCLLPCAVMLLLQGCASGFSPTIFTTAGSAQHTQVLKLSNQPNTVSRTVSGQSIKTSSRSSLATINDIRIWHAPERSRIVFDMQRSAKFSVFALTDPHRVVIDLAHAEITSSIPPPSATGQFIRRIRRGTPKEGVTRLVFDLNKPVRYFIQMLSPSNLYQYRLVVDFYHRDAVVAADKRKINKKTTRTAQSELTTLAPPAVRRPKSELVILIDPGHGGEDPGALGKRTQEKKVVLQIAKKLKAQIDRIPGMRAELTRSGEYYISLRKRIDIARKLQADLFISVHADGFKDKRARGASVYALSRSGASSESAKWLADQENSADLVGGVSLADEDALLAEVLLDLSMSDTLNESYRFGQYVLSELKKVGKVHSTKVERAGFVVLKSPDIPSILVETAYITNPQEEKLLMNPAHQTRIATAIRRGVERYIAKNKSRYAIR